MEAVVFQKLPTFTWSCLQYPHPSSDQCKIWSGRAKPVYAFHAKIYLDWYNVSPCSAGQESGNLTTFSNSQFLYCPQWVANNWMRVHNREPSAIEWRIKFRRPNGITIIKNFTVKKRDEQTLINVKLLHLLLACTVWLLPNSPWWWKKRSIPFVHLPTFSYQIRSTILPLKAPENLGEVDPCWSVAYNNVNP